MPITYDISYTYTGILIHIVVLITDRYLYRVMPMYYHIIHVFLFLNESTLLRNWNHSNRIIQTKVMAFSCQTSQFTNYTRDSLYYSFFRGLNFIFDIVYLYVFKAKVLRVLIQLESPKSEHRNSSYILKNRGLIYVQKLN